MAKILEKAATSTHHIELHPPGIVAVLPELTENLASVGSGGVLHGLLDLRFNTCGTMAGKVVDGFFIHLSIVLPQQCLLHSQNALVDTVGKVAELQRKAEWMFRPEGIRICLKVRTHRYIAFERSASMSRNSRLCSVREDVYEPLKERMMLGMTIGKCQLSKLYAYNGLLFTGGRRVDSSGLLNDKRIIVIDNPKSIVPNVDTITVEDDGSDAPVREYHRVEKRMDIEITEFDGEGLVSPQLASHLDPLNYKGHPHHSFQIRLPYICAAEGLALQPTSQRRQLAYKGNGAGLL